MFGPIHLLVLAVPVFLVGRLVWAAGSRLLKK
jgi:hypothetical protein